LDAEGSCLPDGSVERAVAGMHESYRLYAVAHAAALNRDRCLFYRSIEDADRLRYKYRKFKGTDWYWKLADYREQIAEEWQRGR
jgi:hypothetical protein